MSNAMGLRERVALHFFNEMRSPDFEWKDCPDDTKAEMMRAADAAIAEVFAWLEEPTEEMLRAGDLDWLEWPEDEEDGPAPIDVRIRAIRTIWGRVLRAAREAASKE